MKSKSIRMRVRFWALMLVALPLLEGCVTMGGASAIGSLAGAALEAAGLKKPENAPLEIAVAIHAGKNLNAAYGHGAAVVTKIYYLNNYETWLRMDMKTMLSKDEEKTALGSDLDQVREISLIPGRVYNSKEQLPNTIRYIGIATFFHSAYPQRWKYVFDAKEAEKTGIVLGAHACALSVTRGKAIERRDMPRHDPASLSMVRCE